jgi:hypothetical protein
VVELHQLGMQKAAAALVIKPLPLAVELRQHSTQKAVCVNVILPNLVAQILHSLIFIQILAHAIVISKRVSYQHPTGTNKLVNVNVIIHFIVALIQANHISALAHANVNVITAKQIVLQINYRIFKQQLALAVVTLLLLDAIVLHFQFLMV